jgi:hypothetical protein
MMLVLCRFGAKKPLLPQAALMHCTTLHKKTEAYANTKVCNGLGGETTLAAMPQVRASS